MSIQLPCPFFNKVVSFFFFFWLLIVWVINVFVYCLYQKYHLQLSSSIQLIVFSFCWFPLLHEKFLFDVFDLCICFLVSLVWSSIQFTSSVMSDSLWPHEPQHASPLCPSPTPRVHPNPCPLCRWCHPTISSSVVPFSCPQSFPASGYFQMSQLSTSGGQSIKSCTFNISPSNEHPGLISFRMDWLDLLAVHGTLKNLLQHDSSTVSILRRSAFFPVRFSHPYMTTEKTTALIYEFLSAK